MRTQGNALPYVAGNGHIPIPLAHTTDGIRPAHQPRTPRPTGLDWAALTPTCPACRTKSTQIDHTGLCPTCRGDAPKPTTTGRTGRYQELDPDEIAALLNDLLTALQTPAAPPGALPVRGDSGEVEARRPTPRRASTPRTTTGDPFPLHKAKQLLHDGHTVPQIATALGCAVSTARRHLRNAGITIPDGRTTHSGGANKITDPTLTTAVCDAYTNGTALPQVAKDHGISLNTANRILTEHGITKRPGPHIGRPLTDADHQHIRDRYTAGDPLDTIARTLGVKTTRVRQALTDAGIPIRPRGGPTTTTPPGTATATIRAWAHTTGHLDPMSKSGRLPRTVIDAYLAAHPTTEKETPA